MYLDHRLKFSPAKGPLEVKAAQLTASPGLGPSAKATESAGSGQLKGPLALSPASNSRRVGKGITTGTGLLMNQGDTFEHGTPQLILLP